MIYKLEQNINNKNLNAGFEKNGHTVFPNTSVTMEAPLKNGRPALTFTPAEKKKIEEYFNIEIGSPDWKEFLLNYDVTVPSHAITINDENPADLLKFKIIQSVQTLAANNLEQAGNPMNNFQFYFYSPEEEIQKKVEVKQALGRSWSMIEDTRIKNPTRLIYIAKFLTNNQGIGDNVDFAYDILTDWIQGKIEVDSYLYKFQLAFEKPEEELSLAVDIKEAIEKQVIRRNSKNQYYNPISNTEFGKNIEEVINFMLTDKMDEMGKGLKTDKTYSIRYQLNQLKTPTLK